MNPINIFCLPFAGGSKYSYHGYVKQAPASVRLIPLDLPGRGARAEEALLTDLHRMVDDVMGQIRDRLTHPFAFYGHSMGALLAYLVAKRIAAEGLPQPLHLFLTGRGAPSQPETDPPRHLLPRREFMEKLRELGGSPTELLENEELMGHFEPILRADFKALDTFRYQASAPLEIPICVMIGTHEKITYAQAQSWQQETILPITVRQLAGNHFFIFDYEAEIVHMMAKKTKECWQQQQDQAFYALSYQKRL